MASETPDVGRLACAVSARRRNLVPRVTAAALLALMASRLIGWNAVAPWLGVYAAAQLLETWAWAPFHPERPTPMPAWRLAFGFLSVVVNASAFGGISIPLELSGGSIGGLCAAFVLTAALINAVITSPGSKRILTCAAVPQFSYLAVLIVHAANSGQQAGFAGVAALGALVFSSHSIVLWRAQEKARESEVAARSMAEQRGLQLEAAIAAKSRFTAVVSHELRTPISALMAGAGQLKGHLEDREQLQHLALIEDAGALMKALLDDILDQAKLEAQRMTVEETPFSLRALLAQTLRMWRTQAHAKGLRLAIEGADTAPDWLTGDPTRIRQVLNNLMSNALKFTEKGSVTLSLAAWPADDEACALMVRVIDTGEGMGREQRARLFTPFDQLDAATARNFGGTGLGLAISRQLARLMGGDLTASSEPGLGTTFTLALTLPIAHDEVHPVDGVDPLAELEAELKAAPTNAPAAPAAVPQSVDAHEEVSDADDEDSRPLRALVVDDHEINRRAVELVLAPLGASITTAVNGKLAVEAALREAFDIIIMDVRMPEMNGREATRSIRNTPGPNQSTPVIAVTADSDVRDVQACLDAGMDWFIAKPIEPAKLVQTVVEALQTAAEVQTAQREVA